MHILPKHIKTHMYKSIYIHNFLQVDQYIHYILAHLTIARFS
jgi:hypothetical protein